MLKAREAQAANPIEDEPVKSPSLLVLGVVAIVLVLTSLAIHFFWPVS